MLTDTRLIIRAGYLAGLRQHLLHDRARWWAAHQYWEPHTEGSGLRGYLTTLRFRLDRERAEWFAWWWVGVLDLDTAAGRMRELRRGIYIMGRAFRSFGASCAGLRETLNEFGLAMAKANRYVAESDE